MPITKNLEHFQTGNAKGKKKLNDMVDAIQEIQADLLANPPGGGGLKNPIQLIVHVNGGGFKSVIVGSDGNTPQDITA